MKSQLPIRTLTPDFGGVNARYGFAGSTGIRVWFFIGLLPDTGLARRSGRVYRF